MDHVSLKLIKQIEQSLNHKQVVGLSGDTYKLYLWFLIQNLLMGEESPIRASLSLLAKGTGLSQSTVSRALVRLRRLGILKALEINYKLGNLWLFESFDTNPRFIETP